MQLKSRVRDVDIKHLTF